MLIPKDALAATDGYWVIENAGVDPDVQVSAAPDEAVTGNDNQLNMAVQAVLKTLSDHPTPALRAPPALPAYPLDGEVPPARFAQSP